MGVKTENTVGDKVTVTGELWGLTGNPHEGDQQLAVIEMGSGLDRYRIMVPQRFVKLAEKNSAD